jgi:hypothetical protein
MFTFAPLCLTLRGEPLCVDLFEAPLSRPENCPDLSYMVVLHTLAGAAPQLATLPSNGTRSPPPTGMTWGPIPRATPNNAWKVPEVKGSTDRDRKLADFLRN